MIDRYTKVVLTIIAAALVGLVVRGPMTTHAWGDDVVQVHVVGGTLDYETDITGGPTLKVCTSC